MKTEHTRDKPRRKWCCQASCCIIKNHPDLPLSGNRSGHVCSAKSAMLRQLEHTPDFTGTLKEDGEHCKQPCWQGDSHLRPVLVRKRHQMVPLPRYPIFSGGGDLAQEIHEVLPVAAVFANGWSSFLRTRVSWAPLHIKQAGWAASFAVLPLHRSGRDRLIRSVFMVGL